MMLFTMPRYFGSILLQQPERGSSAARQRITHRILFILAAPFKA